jgi:hypothetical protein
MVGTKGQISFFCFVIFCAANDRRRQLDTIAIHMDATGAPTEDVQFVVNVFKNTYGTFKFDDGEPDKGAAKKNPIDAIIDQAEKKPFFVKMTQEERLQYLGKKIPGFSDLPKSEQIEGAS